MSLIQFPRLTRKTPADKPHGQLELDRANPFYRGLVRAWVPQGGGGPVVDLATGGSEARSFSGAVWQKDGVEAKGANECFATAAGGNAFLPDQGTIMMVWRKTVARASFRYFWYTNSFSAFAMWTDATKFSFNLFGNTGTITNAAAITKLEDGAVRVLGGGYTRNQGAGGGTVYLDGESLGDKSATNTAPSSDIFCFGGRDDSTARYSGGSTLGFFFWDRRFNDEEAKQFSRDPWQLVKPMPLYALPPAVAGAGPSGRIMSSLAHHGGLAGSGGIAGIGGGLAA